MVTENKNGAKHEKSDFNTDFVWSSAWTLLGLMFGGLVIAFLLFAGYNRIWLAQDPQPSRLAATLPARPPKPWVQEMPAQELKEFRQREAEALASYGWVEPNAGVVRIPIERAMELTLERGLPVREIQGKEERGKGNEGSPPSRKR